MRERERESTRVREWNAPKKIFGHLWSAQQTFKKPEIIVRRGKCIAHGGDLCSQSIHIYDVRLPSTWREFYSDVVMPGNLEIVMIVMGSCRVASFCSSCVNIPKAFAHPWTNFLRKPSLFSLSPLHISLKFAFFKTPHLFFDTYPSHFLCVSDFLSFRNFPPCSLLLPIIKGSSAEGFRCGDEHCLSQGVFQNRRNIT